MTSAKAIKTFSTQGFEGLTVGMADDLRFSKTVNTLGTRILMVLNIRPSKLVHSDGLGITERRPMFATLSSRCAICSGRILKGRSRIERTLDGWAHEACAAQDPDHQRSLCRRAGRAMKQYRPAYKD